MREIKAKWFDSGCLHEWKWKFISLDFIVRVLQMLRMFDTLKLDKFKSIHFNQLKLFIQVFDKNNKLYFTHPKLKFCDIQKFLTLNCDEILRDCLGEFYYNNMTITI